MALGFAADLAAQGVDLPLLFLNQAPSGMAVDPQGNLLLSLPASISRYTPQGGLIESFAAPNNARGVAVDAEGVVYAFGTSLQRIGGSWSAALPVSSAIIAIAFDPQNNPVALTGVGGYFPFSYTQVLKFDRGSGQLLASWTTQTLTDPTALTVDAAGFVYVTGMDSLFFGFNGYAIKLDGSLQTVVFQTALGVGQPNGIAVDVVGKAYVVGTVARAYSPGEGWFYFGTNQVTKLDATGAVIASAQTGGNYVAFTPSGRLLVAGGIYPATGAFLTGCGPPTDLGGFSVTALDPATLQGITSAFLAQQTFAGAAAAGDGSLFVATQSGRVLHVAVESPSSPVSCVVNGATYLVESSIEPGEVLTIFGAGLGTAPLTTYDESQQLPFLSNGTEVHIGGHAAPILAVSPAQINIVVPYEITPGTAVNLEVIRDGRVLYTCPMNVAARNIEPLVGFTSQGTIDFWAYQPSFPSQPINIPLAGALNADGTVNSATNPAHVGTTVTVLATGFGPLGPVAPADGQPGGIQPFWPTAIGSTQPANILVALGGPELAALVRTIPGRTNGILGVPHLRRKLFVYRHTTFSVCYQ